MSHSFDYCILLQYFCSTSPLFISRVCRDCSLHNKMKMKMKWSTWWCVQEMQAELESARTEVKRQADELSLSAVEKERLIGKLKAAEGTHSSYHISHNAC